MAVLQLCCPVSKASMNVSFQCQCPFGMILSSVSTFWSAQIAFSWWLVNSSGQETAKSVVYSCTLQHTLSLSPPPGSDLDDFNASTHS